MTPLELFINMCYAILPCLLLITIFHFKKVSHKGKNQLPPSPLALPIIGHLHLLAPLLHQALHKLSSRYGPLMYLRLGSVHAVVASNPEMAKEFLKTHDLTFAHRVYTQVIEYITYNAATPMGPYGPVWIFIKKLSVSELFGSQTLEKFHAIRTKELHRFLGRIIDKSNAGGSVNVTREALRLFNNIISQMITSKKCLGDGDNEELLELVREVTQILAEFNVSDFIPFFKKVDLQGTRRKAEDIRGRYDVLLERIIQSREQERRKSGKNDGRAKDFLDLLLDVSEDENSEVQVSRNHIKGLLLDYLTAGTDSTSVAIEWVIAEMIKNPRVFQKAREEIHKVVGANRLVEEMDTPSLPYIQAILKETLRLHPPIPVVLRCSMEECEVRGYTIPKDTLLIVNIWSIGRDPETWKDPLEFRPERFLPAYEGDFAGSSVDVKGSHYQLLPFGAGRRSCSGTALAMQILPVTVAAMIQCFDWKLAEQPGRKDPMVVDFGEKTGFTTPPACEIVCVPITHFSPPNLME